MRKLNVERSAVATHGASGSSVIEVLEGRQLLSATAVANLAPVNCVPQVEVSPAARSRVMAGKTRSEVVKIRNTSAQRLTEQVTITLAPSTDGTSACGCYSTPSVTRTLSIRAHGSASVRIPFIAPTTLATGKYQTVATVQVGATTIRAAATRSYSLVLPPAPLATSNLVGSYFGIISGSSTSHGNVMDSQATFSWNTTEQTTDHLSGVFSVGTGLVIGTMTGQELDNSRIHFTLKSDHLKYEITGRLLPDGVTIKGTFQGTVAKTLFTGVEGTFKITRQPAA